MMCNKRYNIVAKAYDKRGRLLSTGKNSYTKSHPIQKHFATITGNPQKIFMHAEVSCLIYSRGKKVHSLHVFRYNARGDLCMAKPCESCMAAIKEYGIEHVFYTTNNGCIEQLNMGNNNVMG